MYAGLAIPQRMMRSKGSKPYLTIPSSSSPREHCEPKRVVSFTLDPLNQNILRQGLGVHFFPKALKENCDEVDMTRELVAAGQEAADVGRGQVEPGPKFQAWTLSGGTSDGYLCSHHRVGCR